MFIVYNRSKKLITFFIKSSINNFCYVFNYFCFNGSFYFLN